MADRVEYIKIARIDQDGNDLTNTLEALTQITIPYTSGTSPAVYPVQSITRYSEYFLYKVGMANRTPDPNDSGSLDYNFTSSLSTSSFSQAKIPNAQVSVPMIIDGEETQIFTNNIILGALNQAGPIPEGTQITLNTYPQKQITVGFNFTASITSGEAFFKLYKNNGSTLGSVLAQTSLLSAGTHEETLSVTLSTASISPRDGFSLVAHMGGPVGFIFEGSFNSNSHFFASSSAATGPTKETIPEPYLTSRFYGGDCDVLLNNVELYRENPFLQDIDYSTDPNTPVNFELIISGTAVKGTVPESYYTSPRHINPRYNGCKNQSENINVYPADGKSFSLEDDFFAPSQVNGMVNNNRISSIAALPSEPAVITGNGGLVFGGFEVDNSISNYFKVVTGSNFPSVFGGTMTRQKMLELNSEQLNSLTKDYSNVKIYFDISATVDVTDGDSTKPGARLSLSLFSILSGSSSSPNLVVPRSGEIVATNGPDSYYTPPLSSLSNVIDNDTLNQTVNVQGSIPVSAVTTTRKYLAPSLSAVYLGADATRYDFSNVSIKVSIRGIPLNIGTYGQTSPLDVLDANIYEFEWGGGTTPEILDWGSVKMGKILQVSSKNQIQTINPSQNISTITIPSRRGTTAGRARNYRAVVGNPSGSVYPPGSVPTSSVSTYFSNIHFWDTPQKIGDYYQILNGNNPVNHEVSMFMYPNQSAGSNPTIPSSTKILTTEWGVPTKSSYALTSSNGDVYGTINLNNSPRRFISLDRDIHISRITTDSNGFYNAGQRIKPNWQTIGDQINLDLNAGERWFVTLYNEFEFPNGQGDYNSVLGTGSLSPFNDGITILNNGDYSDALGYKGVYEIAGVYDNFTGSFNIMTYRDFPNLGGIKNIGGNATGNSLGMLIWKARAVGKHEFVIVQDLITGGVGAGAFTSKYVPNYLSENFETITKEYGGNQTG